MQDEPLTVDECDELAEALSERAASLPNGSEMENLLKLAECFRELANIKRFSSQSELTSPKRGKAAALSSDVAY